MFLSRRPDRELRAVRFDSHEILCTRDPAVRFLTLSARLTINVRKGEKASNTKRIEGAAKRLKNATKKDPLVKFHRFRQRSKLIYDNCFFFSPISLVR